MPAGNLTIQIPLTPLTNPYSLVPAYADAPPPYSISPLSLDPELLARAMQDYRENKDPARWGTRRPANRYPFDEPELTGIVGWLIWVIDLFDPAESVSGSSGSRMGGYLAMGCIGST